MILVLTALSLPGVTASAAPATVPLSAAPRAAAPAAVALGDATGVADDKNQKKGAFNPRRGVTFNSAVGGRAAQRTIIDKILRTINSTPPGQQINIFSWNFLSSHAADALLRAQRRGVKVRLLMDQINNTEIENGPYRKLRAGLYLGNKGKPAKRRSWARTCFLSCRGTGGQAHSKFYMFSRVGKTKRVVIQGSANLTEAATFNQWNDVYTHIRNQDVWDYYYKVFQQSATDRKEPRPILTMRSGTFKLIQFPLVQGRDPVVQLLEETRCKGATNTASGVTRIRIAPDVMRNERGMRIAKLLKNLWNRGCDIKIGYTIVGIDVGQYLRSSSGRGPVPMRHLVQDLDGDGEFDNYFHLKSMSIIGNMVGGTGKYAVLNGSSNWSGSAARSDENIGIYRNKADALAYDKHIDYWYNRFASSSLRSTSPFAAMRATGRIGEPGALVFGDGEDAIYEDGSPYSLTGIDPYANYVD